MQETFSKNLLFILHFLPLLILLLLTACGGGPHYKSGGVSSRYSNYMPGHPKKWNPPGPPLDPWGPYINQSSQRFNVPDQWIRAIILQETRGYQYYNKRPVTSPHGAKGLMQIKSTTYKALAKRYSLGSDVYDPHDNIMAGTGYIRTLYNKYGAPGFVAAYHGGPGTLNAYLQHGKALPKSTKNYLISVTPHLGNAVPMSGPFASFGGIYARKNTRKPLPLEAYYTPKPYTPVQMVTTAQVIPAKSTKELKKFIVKDNEQAIASNKNNEPPIMIVPSNYKPSYSNASNTNKATKSSSVPSQARHQTPIIQTSPQSKNYYISTKGNWNIQVGAFSSPAQANHAISMAKQKAASLLVLANPTVESVRKSGKTLYRAKLGGLSYATALQACNLLKIKKMNCAPLQ